MKTQRQTDAKAVTIDKPQERYRHSMAKEIGPLSCALGCFNGIVSIVEIINHVIQKYVKGVQRFNSLRVFIKHAYERYDAMITFIQIVYTFHT